MPAVCCCWHVGRSLSHCPQLNSTPRTTSLSHAWSAASLSAKVSSVPYSSKASRVRAGHQSHPQVVCPPSFARCRRSFPQLVPRADPRVLVQLAGWRLRQQEPRPTVNMFRSSWHSLSNCAARSSNLLLPQRCRTSFRCTSEPPRHCAHSDRQRSTVVVHCLRLARLLAELRVGRRLAFHNQLAQFPRCLLAALRDPLARQSLDSSAHVPASRLALRCLRLPPLRRLFRQRLVARASFSRQLTSPGLVPSEYLPLSISVRTLILCPLSVSFVLVCHSAKISGAAVTCSAPATHHDSTATAVMHSQRPPGTAPRACQLASLVFSPPSAT